MFAKGNMETVFDEDRKYKKKMELLFKSFGAEDPNVCLLASRSGKFHGVQKADANMSRLCSW